MPEFISVNGEWVEKALLDVQTVAQEEITIGEEVSPVVEVIIPSVIKEIVTPKVDLSDIE